MRTPPLSTRNAAPPLRLGVAGLDVASTLFLPVALAVLESARERKEILLQHQNGLA